MEIKIIKKEQPISKGELEQMAREMFGDLLLIKAVIDVEQEIMAIGGEFHSDGQTALMEQEESKGEHTWGINLYPESADEQFIEFDSMVNLKPAFGNRSRAVENLDIQEKIKGIVKELVQ